jgi:hypothetical protein
MPIELPRPGLMVPVTLLGGTVSQTGGEQARTSGRARSTSDGLPPLVERCRTCGAVVRWDRAVIVLESGSTEFIVEHVDCSHSCSIAVRPETSSRRSGRVLPLDDR